MNKLLMATIILLATGSVALAATTSERFGFRSVNDPAYGAVCGTTSDDSGAFQDALDAAETDGGGTVYVPACATGEYYYFLAQIYVPSNVTLLCQEGAVLKPNTADLLTHTLTNSTGQIGFYGVTNAGIENCAIDSTAVVDVADQANPIEIGSATPATGAAWGGDRSDGITVKNVKFFTNTKVSVAGPYNVWVHRANNVKVIGSSFEGGVTSYTSTSDQVGVNIVASNNVEVSGNRCTNMGNTCWLVSAYSSATYANYENKNVSIHDNYSSVSQYGARVGASKDTSTNINYAENIIIAKNAINDPWLTGIYSGVATDASSATAMFRSMVIDSNVVNMSVVSSNPHGIGFGWLANSRGSGVVVSNNSFRGGKGSASGSATCIRLSYANNITFTGNECIGGDLSTAAEVVVLVNDASGSNNTLRFIGNTFGQAYANSFFIGAANDVLLSGNTFVDYAAVTTTAAPLAVLATTARWTVTGNSFKATSGSTSSGCSGTVTNATYWLWRDNNNLTPSSGTNAGCMWTGTLGAASSPSGASAGSVAVVNYGNMGGGTFTGNGTYDSVTVVSGFKNNTRYIVQQTAGDILPFKVVGGSGCCFTITWSAPITNTVVQSFIWEAFP